MEKLLWSVAASDWCQILVNISSQLWKRFNAYASKHGDLFWQLGGPMEIVIQRLTVTSNTSSNEVIGGYRVKLPPMMVIVH
jgi:hypothetical protein